MKQSVLVLGCGKSGIEATSLLLQTGSSVVLYDRNASLDVVKIKSQLSEGDVTVVLGELTDTVLQNTSYAVISPGISLESEDAVKVKSAGKNLISEIELAWRFEKGTVIGITGTNGKTTTTSLVGEIMKAYFGSDKAFTVGNIGVPYTKEVQKSRPDTVSTIELSSFQLETVDTFRPHVSAILNITPDHLNRHHTMEEYARVKEKIASNQDLSDTIVLNASDPYLGPFGRSVTNTNVVWFSGREVLKDGYYLDGDALYRAKNGEKTLLLTTDETSLVGRCNYENILAAFAIAEACGVPTDVIRQTVRVFKAVPHRIEYTATVNGVRYYNDSKGTNPDAAIQGVLAMTSPTVVIGGGYDKGSEFDEWIETFGNTVKKLILIGQTREKIRDTAFRLGFTAVEFAESLEEAVQKAAAEALPGENVLLSPACASWGLFDNYEQRGDLFKQYVKELKENGV